MGKTLPVTAGLCAGLLLLAAPLSANAADAVRDVAPAEATAVARSFPAQAKTRATLAESTSTSVEQDSNWGGIETLNVPATQSPAEMEAQQQADETLKQAKAAEQAQSQAQAEAANRSAARENLTHAAAPTSKDATGLVQYALQYQGYPYMAGGNTPDGWDCSGFTQYVYSQFGVNLPHYSGAQAGAGTIVTDPQPGDLMVSYSHAGIYIGNGLMIHAMNPYDGTKVTAADWSMTFVRVL